MERISCVVDKNTHYEPIDMCRRIEKTAALCSSQMMADTPAYSEDQARRSPDLLYKYKERNKKV